MLLDEITCVVITTRVKLQHKCRIGRNNTCRFRNNTCRSKQHMLLDEITCVVITPRVKLQHKCKIGPTTHVVDQITCVIFLHML